MMTDPPPNIPPAASFWRDDIHDLFGLDTQAIQKTAPLFDRLLDQYFRISVAGLENIPSSGQGILVSNHGGPLPWDALVLTALCRRVENGGRALRPLLEDAVMTAPFLGAWMAKLGAVRASQENALRLLERGALTAVFPEGMQGLGKPYRRRHKLMRFGRGGFVRLALKTGAPLIPVAVVGAEDTAPLLARWELLVRGLGVPYLPITPLFPWLGPLGVLPLPAKWSVRFLPPIDAATWLKNNAQDKHAQDKQRQDQQNQDKQQTTAPPPVAVAQESLNDNVEFDVVDLATHIRDQLQREVDTLVAARGNPWLHGTQER